MASLAEYSFNILNLLRGGRGSNNDYYSLDQIAFTIGYYRSLIIRRDLDKSNRTYELEQDLGLVGLELVDPSEGVMPLKSGMVLRSSRDIPETIRLRERNGITAVTTADRRVQIPVIDYQAARWQQYNKYTKGTPRSFVLNNRVYLVGDKLTTSLNLIISGDIGIGEVPADTLAQPLFAVVRGVFADPRKVYEFQNPDSMWDDNMEYHLPGDVYQRIVQSLLSGEFKVLSSTESDLIPDGVPTNG